MNAEQVIESLTKAIQEINERLDGCSRVLTGTPWVVECCPGLYLTIDEQDKEKLRGGSITRRVVQFTPERIDEVVDRVKQQSAGVFDNARKVYYVDALRTERAALTDIIERLEAAGVEA
jgi:hypothetical protein